MAAEADEDEMEDNGKMNVGPDPLGLGIKTVCCVEGDEDVDGSNSLILFTVAEIKKMENARLKQHSSAND